MPTGTTRSLAALRFVIAVILIVRGVVAVKEKVYPCGRGRVKYVSRTAQKERLYEYK